MTWTDLLLGLFVFGTLALAYIVVTGLVVNWRPKI